jgi:hypothetical protein
MTVSGPDCEGEVLKEGERERKGKREGDIPWETMSVPVFESETTGFVVSERDTLPANLADDTTRLVLAVWVWFSLERDAVERWGKERERKRKRVPGVHEKESGWNEERA